MSLPIGMVGTRKYKTTKSHLSLLDAHEPEVLALFEASISVEVGDGTRCLYWKDRLLQGKSMPEVAHSHLVSVKQLAQEFVSAALFGKDYTIVGGLGTC